MWMRGMWLFLITNFELRIFNYELRIMNYVITNYELRIMNYELRITDYELRITNYELWMEIVWEFKIDCQMNQNLPDNRQPATDKR
jgi:hypothetical protein